MATASLRIASSDPASPKVVTLRSQIGNAQQTADCDVDSITATEIVGDNEVFDDTLAEANAGALAQATAARGNCQWTNDQQDCPSGYTGDSIPAGTVTSEVSKAAANAAAEAALVCVPGEPPGPFNPGANDEVRALAQDASGNILVGGLFTQIDGTGRNRIARLAADATLDTGFNPNADAYILALAVQANGKILVGGNFGTIGGGSHAKIARLETDGTADASFTSSASSYPNQIAVQDDGKIVVVGNFSQLNATSRNLIGRLNADGTLDSGFTSPAGGTSIYRCVVLTDGTILIGGLYSISGGGSNMHRLNSDGTRDATFAPAPNNQVTAIAVQSDGKIIVGGTFTSIAATARNRIARLNADGTIDTSFNPDSNGVVAAIVIQSNGEIIIGGDFTTIGGVTRNRMAKLASDGSLVVGYNPNVNNVIADNCILMRPSDFTFIGGLFTQVSVTNRNRIARLNPDGTLA